MQEPSPAVAPADAPTKAASTDLREATIVGSPEKRAAWMRTIHVAQIVSEVCRVNQENGGTLDYRVLKNAYKSYLSDMINKEEGVTSRTLTAINISKASFYRWKEIETQGLVAIAKDAISEVVDKGPEKAFPDLSSLPSPKVWMDAIMASGLGATGGNVIEIDRHGYRPRATAHRVLKDNKNMSNLRHYLQSRTGTNDTVLLPIPSLALPRTSRKNTAPSSKSSQVPASSKSPKHGQPLKPIAPPQTLFPRLPQVERSKVIGRQVELDRKIAADIAGNEDRETAIEIATQKFIERCIQQHAARDLQPLRIPHAEDYLLAYALILAYQPFDSSLRHSSPHGAPTLPKSMRISATTQLQPLEIEMPPHPTKENRERPTIRLPELTAAHRNPKRPERNRVLEAVDIMHSTIKEQKISLVPIAIFEEKVRANRKVINHQR